MNNHDFETIIQYNFRDKNLLEKALTHSSYCREHNVASKDSNERLEFLLYPPPFPAGRIT